jgi:hypothetical protein
MKYLIAVLCSALAVQFAPAAFTVTLAVSGGSPASVPLIVAGTPSATPGTTITPNLGLIGLDDGFGNESTVRLNNGVTTITAIENTSPYGSIYSALSSGFTLRNTNIGGLGVTASSVIVTIVQDAYSFSGVQNAFFTTYTATNTIGSSANTSVSFTSSAGSSTLSTGTASLASGSAFGLARGSFSGGGANPTSIVQQFTITNLNPGQTITFSNVLTTISTPVPATAFALLAGVPVLALARRRLFA